MARAAADKLIAEKTGKGYRAVDTPSAAQHLASPPSAAVYVDPAATSEPALPDWLPQATLDEIVAKLGKKSRKSAIEIIAAIVGDGEVGNWPLRCQRTDAAVAIVIDRGLLPPQHLVGVIHCVAVAASWM